MYGRKMCSPYLKNLIQPKTQVKIDDDDVEVIEMRKTSQLDKGADHLVSRVYTAMILVSAGKESPPSMAGTKIPRKTPTKNEANKTLKKFEEQKMECLTSVKNFLVNISSAETSSVAEFKADSCAESSCAPLQMDSSKSHQPRPDPPRKDDFARKALEAKRSSHLPFSNSRTLYNSAQTTSQAVPDGSGATNVIELADSPPSKDRGGCAFTTNDPRSTCAKKLHCYDEPNFQSGRSFEERNGRSEQQKLESSLRQEHARDLLPHTGGRQVNPQRNAFKTPRSRRRDPNSLQSPGYMPCSAHRSPL